MAESQPSLLRATFVRQRGKRDSVYVTRSDLTTTSWLFPSYGEGLPHDLVHLVVEACFGLRQAFWGRVDDGADPARINQHANRTGGPDKYRAFGPDQRAIMVAEALAAMHWFDVDRDDAALCESLAESCAQFGVETPPNACPDRIAIVRQKLGELRRRWRALGDAGALALTFRPDDPEAGVAEL